MPPQMHHAHFHTSAGADEHYFSLDSEPRNTFTEEAGKLLEQYTALTHTCGHAAMVRIHLSDIANQAAPLRPMLKERGIRATLIGQPPAEASRLALEAWHLHGTRIEPSGQPGILRCGAYTIAATTSTTAPAVTGSHAQTKAAFEALQTALLPLGGNVADHTVRTWLYCRDIDNNYAGLVEARNAWFDKHGLTRATHYIASTGIEGQMETPSGIVCMDALSLMGLQNGQTAYMEAPKHLSPTHLYGVAFERGTHITYGDRSAFYISGTASIDSRGDIVHPGDIVKQTHRTVENIRALMENRQASLDDLKQAVVYLRDPADAAIVRRELSRTPLAHTPHIILKAPVCRPGWLIEIEAVGLTHAGDSRFAPLG